MQSIKLHEATREFKISNKLAMFFLEKLNIPVKSHSSVITMEQLELLREFPANKEKYSHILEEFDRIEKEEKLKKAKSEKTPEEPIKAEFIDKREPPEEKIKKEEPQLKVTARGPERESGHEIRPGFKPGPGGEREKITEPGVGVERERKPAAHAEHAAPSRPAPGAAAKLPSTPPSQATPSPVTPSSVPTPSAPTKPPSHAAPSPAAIPTTPPPPPSPPPHAAPPPVTIPPTPSTRPTPPSKEEPRAEREKGDKVKFKESGHLESSEGVEHHEYLPPHRIQRPPQPRKKEKPKIKDKARLREERIKAEEVRKAKQLEIDKKKQKLLSLPGVIQTSNFINARELAEKLNLRFKDIEEKMRSLKKEFIPNLMLEMEEIREICGAFGVEVTIIPYEEDIFSRHLEKYNARLSPRAAVVTVMGHVDHGKTTLLDALRHTRVADKEAGGITQKIGAYKLTYKGNDIVFIDTPGHEAFTNIRARGAKVTDIVVLVVAANDGVQPQTVEAIDHARAADVPIVVAINKIDIEGANPAKVKEQLTRHEIVVEDWGGQVVSVEISAKQNQNLDSLLEMLSLVSEMLELKAYKNIPARGTIIESRLDPKLGPMGTVLIQHGQLKRGDFFICGNSIGKVKAIFDHQANVLQQAEVPLPVEIMGFEDVPEAGELFQVTDDIEKAKKVVELRKHKEKENRKDEAFAEKKLSLQNLFQKLEENKTKTIPIVLKTDNFSSGEVLEQLLSNKSQDQLKINILHNGIGNVTESDILLASTSGAMIIGFNVKTPANVMIMAKREKVEIKLYNVIYHLIEDIEKAIKGEIRPEYIEKLIGKVEVLQIFKISKVGIIAGCLVKEGKVTAKSKLKIFRKDFLVFEGDIGNLKRVKNDVAEVVAGTECGIRIKNFNDMEIGDIIETYEVKLKT